MKRKLALVILLSCLGLASCGAKVDNNVSESTMESEADTYAKLAEAKGYPIDTTLGKTDLPTVDVVTEENTENTETTPEATESKSEINENDSQTSEGEANEDNVEQTTSTSDSLDDIASAKSYTLSEQEKADLRTLGATEEQINNVKSGQDFIDLVYKLVNGGSSSAGGSSSSSTGTDSSESFGDEVYDPSRDNQLGSGDTVQGRM